MVRSTRFGVPVQPKKQCPNCRVTVPVWHFLANPVMPNGCDVMCYTCRAKMDMNQPNIVAMADRPVTERAKAKQRVRSEFTMLGLRERTLDRDGRCCVVCGYNEALEVHHMLSVAEGGKNSMVNLVTLCPNHHKAAHAGTLTVRQLRAYVRASSDRQNAESVL